MSSAEGENAAAEIVASVLMGKADCRDDAGAPSATHDFDVMLPDGTVVALEITTAAHTPFFSF
jgi:hypothetical protein